MDTLATGLNGSIERNRDTSKIIATSNRDSGAETRHDGQCYRNQGYARRYRYCATANARKAPPQYQRQGQTEEIYTCKGCVGGR